MNYNILITGGAGFIGSHVVRFFTKKYSNYNIFNLDNLNYAANLKNLEEIENSHNYTFIKGDILDSVLLRDIFLKYKIDRVIHIAAESHVDRSIKDPFSFAHTNVIGTLSLLEIAKEFWFNNSENKLFYHISTDEVFGSIELDSFFDENSNYNPRSPYAASKASSDHFVRSFGHTYGIPFIISNCSNNYGPCQFPEKLIPLFVSNIIDNKFLPIYGTGNNIRDWLYVADHVNAIDLIFHNGKINESYNIGGAYEISNLELTQKIIKITDRLLKRKEGYSNKLIRFVDDRLGHDFRYAINFTKLREQLGWSPKTNFESGLESTIKWYIKNKDQFRTI
tara:strand:- start:4388 stop:5395 length:1008 start_codon:yes stop_codon:yes gene_type:complete